MNWKLIFGLSVFGIIMSLVTAFGIVHQSGEVICWLVIFVFYALIITRKADGKFFLHAFFISIINGIWIGIIHSILFNIYTANNPAAMESHKQLPQSISPRAMMLIMGPIIGVVSGIVAGLFALIASKLLIKPKEPGKEGMNSV